MAKFGLFYGKSTEPSQVIEGDYMDQDREFVAVYKTGTGKGGTTDEQVGAFHLTPGSVVKKL